MLLNPYRFGAFLPSDLTNYTGHWDFDDLSTQTLSGSNIITINDKTGNGNNFGQGGAGQRPVSTSVGLKKMAQFDGSDDFLLADDDALLDVDAGSAAWFIIFKSNDLSDGALLAKGSDPLAPRYNIRVGNGTNKLVVNINDNVGGGDDYIIDSTEDWTDDTMRLATLVLERDTDDEWKVYSDGVETAQSGVAVTTASVASTQRVYMGIFSQSSGFPFGGKIGEIVYVKGSLPGTELADMNTYLMNKWGI